MKTNLKVFLIGCLIGLAIFLWGCCIPRSIASDIRETIAHPKCPDCWVYPWTIDTIYIDENIYNQAQVIVN